MSHTALHHHVLITATSLLLVGLAGGCSAQQPAPVVFKPQPAHHAPSHPAVTVATRMLGIPYRYGGDSPQRGFDCSGLIHYSFSQAGIHVSRTTDTLYADTFTVEPTGLQEGDLLFFRIEGKVSHVGLYVGGKRFVHAPSSGKRVSYATLDNPYWRDRLVKAGRLF